MFSASVLNNQLVPPSFCLCFTFAAINFRGLLHHVCDVLIIDQIKRLHFKIISTVFLITKAPGAFSVS